MEFSFKEVFLLHISLQDSSITFKIFELIEGTLSSNCRSQTLSSTVLMENPSWNSSFSSSWGAKIKDILTGCAICIDLLRWGFWIVIFLLLTILSAISWITDFYYLNLVEIYSKKNFLWVFLLLLPVFNKILYCVTLFSKIFVYTYLTVFVNTFSFSDFIYIHCIQILFPFPLFSYTAIWTKDYTWGLIRFYQQLGIVFLEVLFVFS